MTRAASEFAIRSGPAEPWGPCDPQLNLEISRAMEDLAGLPGSITVRDVDGEAHTLSPDAGQVLYLALFAMDARLRPGGCYREKADEIYTALAAGIANMGGGAVEELRKVFMLGAQRPWLMPAGEAPDGSDDDEGSG